VLKDLWAADCKRRFAMRGMNRNLAIAFVLLISLGYPATIAAVSFGPETPYPVGTSPFAVVVGDFNHDGKPDVAVANSGSNFVSILLGNGNGTFQPALMADAGGPQSSIVVGDFNGDGKLDLVVNSGPGAAGAPHGVSILLGNGDGTFKPPVQIQTYLNNVQVAVGDFNRDSKLDLVVLEPQLASTDPAPFLNIFLGKGDGTFQSPTTIGLVGTAAGAVAVGDFNGDGKPDVAAESGNHLSILLGIGDGTFQSPVVTTLGNAPLFTLLVGDFNGDNKQDLVTRATTTATSGCRFFCFTLRSIQILLSNGNGTFQVSGLGLVGISSSLAAGDVNGDGKLDVAVLQSATSTLHLGKGDGTFPVVLPFTLGSAPVSGKIADLNGDNLPDLVLVNSTAGTVSILLNTSPASGADLSVSFTSVTDPVVQGQNAAYTLQMKNQGPQDATGVIMTINLPANSTLVSAVPTQGSCNAVQITVTCNLGPLPSPSVAGATITLAPMTLGSNTISASVAANEQDLNPADDMANKTFTVIPTFTLTVLKAGAGGGTVTDNGPINCGPTCSATYPSNATVSLVAAADATSVFSSWSGACAGTDPNSCSIPMTSDMTVIATFVPAKPLSVTLAGAGAVGGTVTSTPAGISCTGANCMTNFATGSTVNLTASAASGATFVNWSGACSGTNPNTCAVSMTAAQSVTANFNFSPPLDFMLNLATALSVSGGNQVPDTITLSPQNPLGSMVVSFTCSVSPALAQCSFSLPTVTLGSAPASTDLTIVAIKPPGTASIAPQRPELGLFASLWLTFPALGLAGIGFASKPSRKKKMFAGLLLVFMLGAGVISQSACGSSGSPINNSFTPPGQYNVTVTATSGSIAHSVTVTLNVQ
jgi:uncharacterized repeat protein (TIGR01451 family)